MCESIACLCQCCWYGPIDADFRPLMLMLHTWCFAANVAVLCRHCCWPIALAADQSTAVVAVAGVKRINSDRWCCWSIWIVGFAAAVLLLLLQSASTLIELLSFIADADAVAADRFTAVAADAELNCDELIDPDRRCCWLVLCCCCCRCCCCQQREKNRSFPPLLRTESTTRLQHCKLCP